MGVGFSKNNKENENRPQPKNPEVALAEKKIQDARTAEREKTRAENEAKRNAAKEELFKSREEKKIKVVESRKILKEAILEKREVEQKKREERVIKAAELLTNNTGSQVGFTGVSDISSSLELQSFPGTPMSSPQHPTSSQIFASQKRIVNVL